MIVVANAGPLIALGQISHIDLLRSLFGELRIPMAVKHEVSGPGHSRIGQQEISTANWIHVCEVHNTTAVELLQERLDLGESEAIVLAIELNADLLLIDEARGRRVAESRGMEKTGTLGVLIMAKRRGLIPVVTPLLSELRAAGFRMSEELHHTARLLAGET